MNYASVPSKFIYPFGENAAAGNIRTVPPTTGDPTAASQSLGFPPETFLAIGAGGIAPNGEDFNGILNVITAWNQWQQAGAPVFYDASFSGNISGYPKWSLLANASTPGLFWISTADANTSDPDTGGANWLAFGGGRLLNIQYFKTPGTFTYTPTAGTNNIIVEMSGSGSGSGGTPVTDSSHVAQGQPGSCGGYMRKRITSGFSGSTVIVGAPGVAGTPSANGGPGNPSGFGALTVPGGPFGGFTGALQAVSSLPFATEANPGNPVVTGGDVNIPGGGSTIGLILSATNIVAGIGGQGPMGTSSAPITSSGTSPVSASGISGQGYGAGASPGVSYPSDSGRNGAQGAPGIVIVYEYS